MTVASLTDVLTPALKLGYGVAGLVVLGWEDACAYVEAADDLGVPVILQAGPSCRAHTPVSLLGSMFRYLAEQARVPVVCHIDHALSVEECQLGIDYGFTSVMIDGSSLSLNENIDLTSAVVEIARPLRVSVEAEIGFVGYHSGALSNLTVPLEAAEFESATRPDALAVSIGNTHLQAFSQSKINRILLKDIEAVVSCPLVVHGASGINLDDRMWLATQTSVCKFNIGTELRQTFGLELRKVLESNTKLFDRNQILSNTIPAISEHTKLVFRSLGFKN